MLRARVHDDFGGAVAAEAADTCAHAHVRIRARCLHDERAGCGYWLRLLFRKRNPTLMPVHFHAWPIANTTIAKLLLNAVAAVTSTAAAAAA